jgi:putative ABC transport system permease protein
MAASSEAVPRGESLGRLRALGLRDAELWRIMAGEITAPVLVGALTGAALGLGAAVTMFGHLSLEQITSQVGAPAVSIPPWALLGLAVPLGTALVLTHLEWKRLRGIVLGQLLRR